MPRRSRSPRQDCEGEGSHILCYRITAHGAENGLSDQYFTCCDLYLDPLMVGHAADCVCPLASYTAVVTQEGLGKETAGVAATTLDWSEAPAAKDGLLIQSESRAQVESSQTKPCLPHQTPRIVSRSGSKISKLKSCLSTVWFLHLIRAIVDTKFGGNSGLNLKWHESRMCHSVSYIP
jgi:hypothetical protein